LSCTYVLDCNRGNNKPSDDDNDDDDLVSDQENMADGTFLQIHNSSTAACPTCDLWAEALSCKSRDTWVNFPQRFSLTATSSLRS